MTYITIKGKLTNLSLSSSAPSYGVKDHILNKVFLIILICWFVFCC